MTELERRDLVVSGAVQRHQMRQWLDAHKIEWVQSPRDHETSIFYIDATEAQWEKINEWVEKVKA